MRNIYLYTEVLEKLKISEYQLNKIIFESGINYLNYEVFDDSDMVDKISQLSEFWDFWINMVVNRRNIQFVHRCKNADVNQYAALLDYTNLKSSSYDHSIGYNYMFQKIKQYL